MDKQAEMKNSQSGEDSGAQPIKDAKILVVDDEPATNDIFSFFLSKEGYEVTTAETYTTALDALYDREFDLIFSDINLGGKTGINLLEVVKKRNLLTPVVIITGRPEVETAATSVRLGAFDYIQKPIQSKTIRAIAKKALEHKALLDRKLELEKENEKYRLHLEELVRERTRELEQANHFLHEEITERKRIQEELVIYRDQLEERVKNRTRKLVKEIEERTRVEEKLKKANDELELRVEDRTKELQKAYNALRENEERLKLAMEATSDGLWDYNIQNSRVYFSPRWFTMLGYEPDAFPQVFETWENLLHPKERARIIKSLKANIQKKQGVFQSEYRMKTCSNQYRWILSRGRVVERDENDNPIRMVGTHVDITERKKAVEETKHAYQELDHIFHSTSDGICAVDRKNRIIRINRTLENMFGWKDTECVHQSFYSLLPPYELEIGKGALQKNNPEKERIEYDLYIRLPDGEKRSYILTSTPIRYTENRLSGYLFNIRDITRRVRAEEQARLAEKQLIQADKLASLGILVSGVAHEINNPTNFIMLNSPIIRDVLRDASPILEEYYRENGEFKLANIPFSEMREYIPELVEGIHEGAERIKKIVLSLKDYAREDSYDMHQDVDVNRAITGALTLLDNLIKKSTINFSMTLGNDLPTIKGDFQRIEQIIVNLVQNSCHALTDSKQAIHIQTMCDEKQEAVKILILDEGIGIPEDNIRHIMDPFFTTKREIGGTGLGLSVCAGIAKEHGGTIEFQSEPGKGTTAVLILPVKPLSPKTGSQVENEQEMVSIQSKGAAIVL